MSNATTAPVRRSVFVQAPPERAFRVFADGFDTWWPRSHSVVAAEQEAVYIEPAAGGAQVAESVAGDGGWSGLLAAYAEAAQAAS